MLGDPTSVLVTGLDSGVARVTLVGEGNVQETIDVIVQFDVEYLRTLLTRVVPTAADQQTCNGIERLPMFHYKSRVPSSGQLFEILKIRKLRKTKKPGSKKTADTKNKQQHHSLGQEPSAEDVEFQRNPIPRNARCQNRAHHAG